ncbi:MAG TPA: hypothetical protein VMQ44_00535 [Candidatus Saccharimonadales bacterium]|nr:hypothetical protein [Candidatus Saccharimonadales bacterium]
MSLLQPTNGHWHQLRRYLTRIALVVLLFFIGPFFQASAQSSPSSSVSLTISPLVFELTTNPGDKISNSIMITNANSTTPVDITMDVEPFVGTDTGEAKIVTEQDDPSYSLKQWVTLTPASFHLEPKRTQIVAYTINVPKDAEAGGRYASILASSKQSAIGTTGAMTVQEVGSLILLGVNGNYTYSASAKDFKTVGASDTPDQKYKRLFESGPVHFLTKIGNSGNVHIKPEGFVVVNNIFGKKVVDLPFPQKNIIPNSDRVITTDWNDAKIGYYTATLALNYGEKGGQLNATTAFIVFPWKIGLPIIFLAVLAVWFIIARRKRITTALAIIFGRN